MTIDEFIKELQKLKREGKGEYTLLFNGCEECSLESYEEYKEIVLWDRIR